jgi:PAS domain S-box-containing protein
MRTKHAVTQQRTTLRPNGETVERSVVKFPIFDAEGKLTGIGTISTDISAHLAVLAAERALERSNARFRTLIDNASQGILVHRNYKPLYANQALAEMYGYASPDDILALESTQRLTHEDHRGGKHDLMLAGKVAAITRTVRSLRKNGEPFWQSRHSFAIDWNGELAVCSMRSDVSEQIEAEEALRQQEAQFRGAVSSLQEGFALFDADDRLVIANAEFRRLHRKIEDMLVPGAKFEDLVRANMKDGNVPAAVGKEDEFLRERMEQHRNPQGPVLRTLADGTCYIIQENRTPDGGYVSTRQDITELKRTEAILHAAAESIPDGLALYDEQDRLIYVNENYLRNWPELREVLRIGRTFEEILKEREAKDLRVGYTARGKLSVEERLKQHREANATHLSTDANGRTKQVNEVKTPEGFTAIIRTDITDMKNTELQLVQASKLATLGEISSNIAHELNQPLTAISITVEAMLQHEKKGALDADMMRDALELIFRQKDRIVKTIDHMRAFSRSDAPEFVVFDPIPAVRNAVQLLQEPFRSYGIELALKLPSETPFLLGHSHQLEQVVLNLLTNAKDAILEKVRQVRVADYRPRIAVSVKSRKRKKQIVIAVADNGGGIPEDILPRIFEPFLTTKAEGEGTGLGLSISADIIKGMAGEVSARNVADGAVLEVVLPAAPTDAVAAAMLTEEEEPESPLPSEESPFQHILLVDDEETIRDSMAFYLKNLGYRVTLASGGEEALQLQTAEPADIVISDHRMPGVDGQELAERLHEQHPDLPIVMMTGDIDNDEMDEFIASGVKSILQKPFNLQILPGLFEEIAAAKDT